MRYVPIYLRQGLVIFGLMSGTFILHWLPLSACPGELDKDKFATFRHIFFARLLLDRVVIGLDGGDSGQSQSACPSSSCWFRVCCSSLCLNLKNMSFFPIWKRISPFHMSILALAALRNGRPRIARFQGRLLYPWPRSPQGRRSLARGPRCLRYPLGIPNCRVCELHTHICWGESRV